MMSMHCRHAATPVIMGMVGHSVSHPSRIHNIDALKIIQWPTFPRRNSFFVIDFTSVHLVGFCDGNGGTYPTRFGICTVHTN